MVSIPPSTVLFLAANPMQVSSLQLGEECRLIENMIHSGTLRDRIRFRSRWAARPDDLMQALNEDAPRVLHFSGHGARSQGLCFQAEDGSIVHVSAEGLGQVIRAAGAGVAIVVLNACFSEEQARALAVFVPCVIGMAGVVRDRIAITYAGSFYRALAFGRSVTNAHEQGLAAISLHAPDGQTRDIVSAEPEPCTSSPKLLFRDGTNTDLVYIVEPDSSRRSYCEIRIRGTIRHFNPDVIARIAQELRQITDDLSLEIIDVREGSVRLRVALTSAAVEKLVLLKESGKLDKICGFEVSAVFEVDSTSPEVLWRKRLHEDEEITLDLFRRGERTGAIGHLMVCYQETVFTYCVRRLRDRDLAQDVSQQVFIETFRDLERFRGKGSLRSWLLGIAHHRCADAVKALARRSARIDLDLDLDLDEHQGSTPTPHEQLEHAQRVDALEDCLARLSTVLQEAVLLHFQFGLTYEEMSKLLGSPPQTLADRVARALPLLRRCLERKGWTRE